MVSGSGGGLGGGEGEGSLLVCLDFSGSSGSCSGSGFGAPSWWSCCSAVSSSSSSSSFSSSFSSSELSSSALWWLPSWLSIGGSWTGSWAGFLEGLACTLAWSLAGAFCFAADKDGPAGALVKCPLLSLGSERLLAWVSRSCQESDQGLSRKQEGVPVLWGQGGRRVISPMPKLKAVLKSGPKNVTYS